MREFFSETLATIATTKRRSDKSENGKNPLHEITLPRDSSHRPKIVMLSHPLSYSLFKR